MISKQQQVTCIPPSERDEAFVAGRHPSYLAALEVTMCLRPPQVYKPFAITCLVLLHAPVSRHLPVQSILIEVAYSERSLDWILHLGVRFGHPGIQVENYLWCILWRGKRASCGWSAGPCFKMKNSKAKHYYICQTNKIIITFWKSLSGHFELITIIHLGMRPPSPSIPEEKFVYDALQQSLRLDGRDMHDLRTPTITFGPELGWVECAMGKTR